MLPVLLFVSVTETFAYSPALVSVTGGSVSVGFSASGSSMDPWGPQRTVSLDNFQVSATEVTNADYATFLNQLSPGKLASDPANPQILILNDSTHPFNGKPLVQVSLPTPAPGPLASQILDMGTTGSPRFVPVTTKGTFPVNWVTYYGAEYFAATYSMVLPTAPQWEAAAGTTTDFAIDGTLNCVGTTANAICGTTGPADVGSTMNSQSTARPGLKGMVGNVAEWTTDNEGTPFLNDNMSTLSNPVNHFGYDAGKAPVTTMKFYNKKVVKGGSYADTATTMPTTRKHKSYPWTYKGSDVGFRVVQLLGTTTMKEVTADILEECGPREYQDQITFVATTQKASIICQPCNGSCESCSGPSGSQCLSCPGNIAPSTTGTCLCPTGYTLSTTGQCLDSNLCGVHQFWSQGACSECDQLCKTCAGSFSQCTSCPMNAIVSGTSGCQCAAGFMLTPAGCISDGSMFLCAHGYYKGTTCIPCDVKCRDCITNATTCTKCWPNATLSASACTCTTPFQITTDGKCICPTGRFIDSAGACSPCHASCTTCNGLTTASCLSCKVNASLVSGSCACNTGMSFNAAFDCTPTAGACFPSCQTCFGNQATNCLTCANTVYTLQADSSCDCPLRQYYVSTPAAACKACHVSCVRCSGPDYNLCLKCASHGQLQTDGTCKCDLFYTMDVAGNCIPKSSSTVCPAMNNYLQDNGTCSVCDVSCQTCLGPLPFHCMTCRDPAMLKSIDPGRFNYGYCQCSDKQYMSVDGYCLPCHGSCKRCSGPQATQCIGCEIGFTFEITTNQCVCPTTFTYKDGACVKIPASPSTCTYFQFGATCTNCSPPCTSCTSATACTACSPPRVMSGTTCACGAGFYADLWGQCQPCHSTCATCTGATSTQCVACPPLRLFASGACNCDPAISVLSVESKTCVLTGKVCSSGQYKNERGECVPCHSACKDCVGPRDKECVSCNAPAKLYTYVSPLYGLCNCALGQYYDYLSSSCLACHPSCGDCTGPRSFECLACGANAVLAKTEMGQECQCMTGFSRDTTGQCAAPTSTCPPKTFMNPTNNQCVACDLTCLSCQGSATKCTSCLYPQVIVNGLCQCPDGMTKTATGSGCYQIPDVNCKVYNGQTCTLCFINSFLDTTGKCQCNATAKPDVSGKCQVPGSSLNCLQQFYFEATSMSCIQCHQSCGTCTGPSSNQCVTCPLGRVMNAAGLCSCADGMFMGSDGNCYQCIAGCSRCAGPSMADCQVCFTGLVMMTSGGCVCADTTTTEWSSQDKSCTALRHSLLCNINQYLSSTAGTCSMCPSTCSSCAGPEMDKCMQCVSPFTKLPPTTATTSSFKGVTLGVCGCAVGLFNYNGSCTSCAALCGACQGSTAAQCFSCVPNAKFNSSGVCECLPGYVYTATASKCTPNFSYLECGYAPKKYLSGTTCLDCNSKCLTCDGPLVTNCKVCDPALGFSVTDCTQCASGFFLVAGSCSPCSPTCAACSATTCLTCAAAGMAVVPTTTTCSCNTGTIWNASTKTCLPAGVCPAGTYGNGTTCTPCVSLCASCTGPAMSDCLQCTSPFVLKSGICQCSDGYFLDSVSTICTPCSPSCKRCTGFADNCLECSLAFVIDIPATTASTTTTATATTVGVPPYKCRCPINTKFSSNFCMPVVVDTRCALGDYYSLTGCVACGGVGGCKTCTTNPTTCLSCIQGFVPTEKYGGTVDCKCPSGTYVSGTGSISCAACDPKCAECFAGTPTDCSRCRTGMILVSGLCSCPDGSTWDTTTNQCGPAGSLTCGLGKYSATAGCVNCNVSCATCSGTLATQCTGCDTNRNLMLDTTGACVCQPGFFLPTATTTLPSCQPCDSTCLTCTGPGYLQCLTCRASRTLTSPTTTDKKCVCGSTFFDDGSGKCLALTAPAGCAAGKFQDEDGICKPCHLSCATCLGPAQWHCLTCTATYVAGTSFLATLKSCLCASGMYFSGLACIACDPTCKDCYGGGNFQCNSCKPNAHFLQNSLGMSCECDTGFVRDATGGGCSPQPTATGCKDSAGAVVANPIGKYMQADGTCGTCHLNCWTCLGPNDYDCVTCRAGAYLKYRFDTVTNTLDSSRGSCLCSDYGQFRNASGGCDQCMKNCSKCHGPAIADCDVCGSYTVKSATGCDCITGTALDANGYCSPVGTSSKCYYSMYFDTVSNACQVCNSNCLTCSGPNVNNCASCFQDHTLVVATDGTKTCKCSDGFYVTQTTTYGYVMCGKCFSTCLTCSGPGNDQCLTCPGAAGAYVLTSGQCLCPTGKYYSPITQSCLVSDPTQIGKYVDVELPTISYKSCAASCASCLGGTVNDCTVCGMGGVLQLVSGVNNYYATGTTTATTTATTATTTATTASTTATPMIFNFGRGFCFCSQDYFPDFSGRCFKCDGSCQGCKGPSAYDCAACKVGFVAVTNSTGTMCGCPNSRKLNPTTGICDPVSIFSGCDVRQYSDSTGSCKPCSPLCISCVGPDSSQCATCPPGSILNQTSIGTVPYGKCMCNQFSYLNLTVTPPVCSQCNNLCLTCHGPSEMDCDTCSSMRELVMTTTGTKRCNCKTGYKEDIVSATCLPISGSTQCTSDKYQDSTGACIPCDPKCTSCSGSGPTRCLSCNINLGFLLSKATGYNYGTCICPGNMFVATDGGCQQCYPGCKTCYGSSQSQCLTCFPGSTLSTTVATLSPCICSSGTINDPASYRCVSLTTCPAGKYVDDSGSCTLSCSPLCTTCGGPGNSRCGTCATGFIAKNPGDIPGLTTCLCPDMKFLNVTSGTCNSCDPTCFNCFGSAPFQCLSCPVGRVLKTTIYGQECVCASGYILTSSGCIAAGSSLFCAVSQYQDTTGACKACHATCLSCNGPTDTDCMICKPNSQHPSATATVGPCVCFSNFFRQADLTCVACMSSCAACTTSTTCTSCLPDRVLNSGTNLCTCQLGWVEDATGKCQPRATDPACKSNEFKTAAGVCSPCLSECTTCFGPSASECSSCDYFNNKKLNVLNAANNSGMCTCKDGFFINTYTRGCEKCHVSCLQCFGSNDYQCTSCPANSNLATMPTGQKCMCNSGFLWSDMMQMCESTTACTAGTFLAGMVGTVKSCLACHSSCATCTGPNPLDCLTCKDASMVLGTQGCLCPIGKFNSNGTCTNCDITCLSCVGPSQLDCDKCKANASFQTATLATGSFKTCVCDMNYDMNSLGGCTTKKLTTCATNNQFTKADGTCGTCHALCGGCYGPGQDQCFYCVSSTFVSREIINGNMVGRCDCSPGSFLSGTTCAACNTTCKECTGAADTQCTVCAQYYAKDPTSGKCTCTFGVTPCVPPNTGLCLFGFFNNGTSCQPCISDCQSCIGPSASECLTCKSEDKKALVKTVSGVSGFCQCLSGYYMESGQCKPCDKSCDTCSGPGSNQCFTCKPGAIPLTPGAASPCVCKDSTYVLSPNTNTCIQKCTDATKQPDCTTLCAKPCGSCIGPNSNECLTCATPWVPMTQSGTSAVKCVCPDGMWYDGSAALIDNSCVTCAKSCLACFGPGDNQCTKCPPNSLLSFVGTSSSCPCNSGYSRSTTGSCVPVGTSSVCPPNNYMEATTGTCKLCHASCLTCFGPTDTSCQLCPANAMLTTTGSCVCKSGYWLNATYACQQCDMTCLECKGSSTACTTCDLYSTMSGTTCQCIAPYVRNTAGYCAPPNNGCPLSNQFKNSNNFCVTCDASCETCDAPGPTACKSCTLSKNLKLIPVDTLGHGQCACADGFYLDSAALSCIACDVHCKTCSGPSYQNCLSCPDVANLNPTTKSCDCKPGFIWNKNFLKCVSTTICAPGQWYGLNGCQPCMASCLECMGPSASDCTKCSTSMLPVATYKDDTTQYYSCKCLDNQYADTNGKCAACHTKCATCYGSTEFQCLTCPPNTSLDTSTAGQSSCKCIANFQRDATTGACTPIAIYTDCALSEFKPVGGVCTACNSSCGSCFDANAQSCATCPPGADFIVLSPSTSTVTFGKCACKPGSVSVSGKCVTCGGNCATCFGASASQCATCKPNFTFDAGTCTCLAPLALSNGNCNPVPTNTACLVNQYMSSTGQCMPCGPNCLTCLGPSDYDCVSCYADQLKTLKPSTAGTNVGVCVCKLGTFILSGKCMMCDSSCSSCAGTASNQCWSCALATMTYSGTAATPGTCTCSAGTTWVPTKAACFTACPPSSFLDNSGTCVLCDPACSGCIGPGPDQCVACNAAFADFTNPVAANPKFCKCALGKYFTGTSCTTCDTTKCTECVSAADNCVKCPDPNMTLVNVSGKNVCQCKAGYLLSGTACNAVNQFGCASANMYKDAAGTCQTCDTSCSTCNGPSKYQCVFCKTGAVLTASPVGSCVCPAGFFANADFSCSPCVGTCLACSSTTCLSCPVGQYPSSAACGNCNAICKTCSGSTNTNCLSCFPNANLVSGQCVCADGYVLSTVATAPGCVLSLTSTACSSKQFMDSTGNCNSCHANCYTCTGPFDSNCVACNPGTNTVLLKLTTSGTINVGKCVCSPNSFLDTASALCLPCDVTCLTCNGTGSDRCLTCPATVATAVVTGSGYRCDCASTYIYSPYTVKCELKTAFDTGLWLNTAGQTQKCHYSCTKCIGPNPEECIACSGTRIVDPSAPATALKFKCVCTSGFETLGGDCGVCTGLCNTCTGPDTTKCLTCKVNAFLPVIGPAQCVCAVNYKLDTAGANCQAIVFDTTCTAAQFKNAAGACTSCHTTCGTCLGATDSDCMTCSIVNTNFTPSTTNIPVTGKCLCKAGFFLSGAACTACSAGCIECSSVTLCTRCASTFNLVTNACQCPTGYTISGTSCNPTAVTTCSGTTGMYAVSTTSCSPCHPSCLNCVGPTYTDCLSCKELTLRLTVITATNNSGSCGCQPGTFLSAGTCQQCGPKCATCLTSTTACVTCRTGFTLSGTDCICSAGVFDPVKNACINTTLCTSGNYPDPPNSTNIADCKPCTAPCVTCLSGSNKACLTCPAGMNQVSSGAGTFECQCPNAYYYNPTTNACAACSATCQGCAGSPTNCLACPAGSNRDFVSTGLTGTCNCKFGFTDTAGVCVAQASGTCAIGTWSNSGACTACDPTCQSCVGSTNTNCLICKLSTMTTVDPDSTAATGVKCLCPPGSFWSGTDCVQCPINCKECSSASLCTICKDGNDLTTAGACQCKFGFTPIATLGSCTPPSSSNGCLYNQYLSTAVSPAVCQSCDSSCFSCSGPGSDQCVQCGPNATFDPSRKCACNTGYYFSLTGFVCTACDSTCVKCKGPGVNNCTACVVNKEVNASGACVCSAGFTASGTDCTLTIQGTCLANQYLVGTTCTNCNAACANCTGGLATNCLVCATGYVKDSTTACVCKGFLSGTTCVACHPTCLTCSGAAATNCLTCSSTASFASNTCTCKSGYYWDATTSQCVLIPACPTKTYFDITMRSCQPCYFMCATCSGAGYDTCLSCISGSTATAVAGSGSACQCNSGMYFAQLKNMCVTIPTCTTGTFLDTGLYECKACDVSCKECKNSSPQGCSACNTGLTLWTTGECKCADGYFFSRTDGKCIACNVNCLLCNGPTNNMCSKCAVGFVMNPLGACVCSVQNSYYMTATGECKACNSACLTCIDASNDKCLSCKLRSKLVVANLGVDNFGVCVCDTDSYFDQTVGACIIKPGSCYGSTFVTQSASGGIQCLPCDKSCLQCSDTKATDCLMCSADRKFVKNTVPSTYTGPITGKCDCKFTNVLDPTKCDQIECPAGFFYDTRSTLLAAVCSACDPTCTTCAGPSNYDCRSCPANRMPSDPAGFFKTLCRCRSEYMYPDGTCGTTMYISQAAGGCPLNQALCQSSTCQFTSSGTLLKPYTDLCLRAIYDYCCFSTGKSQCANLGVSFDQCDKITPPTVTPSSPTPIAYFSDDGQRVVIKFTAPVNFLKQDCNAIFANPAALTTSTCQAPDTQGVLIISLAPNHGLVPDSAIPTTTTTTTTSSASGVPATTTTSTGTNAQGQVRVSSLKIQPGVYMAVHNWASATNSDTTITLKAPGTAMDITLQVTYPSVISKCQPYIHLDASASTGGGARSLTFKWTIAANTADIVLDPTRTDQVDLKNYNKASVDTLVVTVTATSFLGKTATKDLTIKLLGGLAPQVSLPFNTFNLNPSKELSVYMQAAAPSCGGTAAATTFTYQWSLDSSSSTTASPSTGTTSLNSSTEPARLKLLANTLTPGVTYVFKAGATMDGTTWGYAMLKVVASSPGLSVIVSGGNRDASTKEAVTLTTDRSTDPLNPTNNVKTDWTYKWTCEDWTSFGSTNPIYADGVADTTMDPNVFTTYKNYKFTDCTDSSNTVLTNSLKVTLDSLSIPAGAIPPNRMYYFKATASKGTRTGFGYSFLRTKAYTRTSKTTIQYYGTNLNATGINSLFCQADCPAGCVLQWNMLTPNVNVKWLSTDLTKPNVAFASDGLLPDTVYRFECATSINGETMSAIAELSLNSAPSGGTFEMTPSEGNVTTVFTATFSNWVDKEGDYPLKYKLWLRDGTLQTLLRVSDNSRIEGLTFPASIGRSMFLISSEICDSQSNCRSSDNRYIKIEQLSMKNATTAVGTMMSDFGKNKDNQNKQERAGSLSIVVQTVSGSQGSVDPTIVKNVLSSVNQECAPGSTQEADTQSQCLDMYKGLSTAVNTTSQVEEPFKNLLTAMAKSTTQAPPATLANALETIGNMRDVSAKNDTTQTAPVDVDGLMKMLSNLALKNTPASAPVEVTSGNLAATFENKDPSDMQTAGSSFTTPPAVKFDNSTKEGRRLQTTNRYQITLPPCMVPKLTDNSTYRVSYWTSSKSDFTFSSDRNRSSYDSDLTLSDSNGNTLAVNNASCPQPISICSQFIPPAGFTPPTSGIYNLATQSYGVYPNITIGNVTVQQNLTNWSFKCQYWDSALKLWSENGVLQNQTVIFWGNLTICCKTTHLTTFSTATIYTSPIPFTAVPDEPKPIFNVRNDNFDGWDNFNGFYVGIILVGVEILLVALGFALDVLGSKTDDRPSNPTITSPSNMIQSKEVVKDFVIITDVQAFESPEEKNFEGDMKHIQDHTIPGADTPGSHIEASAIIATPSFIRFFLYNFFLTGFLIKYKSTYSRSARAAQMCSVLFIELFLTGLFTPVSRMEHFVYPALVSVGIAFGASPFLALGFYTPSGLSKFAKTLKVAFAVLLAVAVIFGSLGACAYCADSMNYSDVQFWMKAFGVAVGLELIGSQIIKVVLKRALLMCSKSSCGGKIMTEV